MRRDPHLPLRSALWLRRTLLAATPIIVAMLLGAAVLFAVGVNPLRYYAYVLERGLLSPSGLQQTLTRMAPLLLLAASLIVAFRAGIWNLGIDGQYLLGAVAAAVVAPSLSGTLPTPLVLLVSILSAAAVGICWSLLPAWLRAYQRVNEIVTTLIMSFLGLSLANVLVKLVFLDPATTVPQTPTLPVAERLPRLFDTTVSSGFIIALLTLCIVHLIMQHTAFGLQLRIVGANSRAAEHAGLPTARLTVAVFALSAALAGTAGAIDIVGVQGNVRADWNPGYGLLVIPAVFLARLNGFAAVGFVLLLAVLSIGGESAARRLGVPSSFTLMLMAIILLILALAEFLEQRLRGRTQA